MLRFALIGALDCLIWCAMATAQDDTPYVAYVVSEKAPVRSGPGRVHYSTIHLTLGDTVEVWRHDPGGWLAVRPIAGSFSWVASKYLKTTDDPALGRITSDDAKAWVGTVDETIREYMWQVRLRRDEPVAVLGKRLGKNKAGEDELWFKIAPPAGEFRWLHEKHVSRQSPLNWA